MAYEGLSFGSSGPKRTENGGRTWVPFEVPAGLIFAVASCPPPYSCLDVLLHRSTLTGEACYLVRSDDRGETWSDERLVPTELCYGSPAIAISPEGPEHLVASCLGSIMGSIPAVCATQDGGQTWTPHAIGSDTERSVESLLFMTGDVVLAATSEIPGGLDDILPSVVSRSVDGGATWAEVASEGGTLTASVARPGRAFVVSVRSNAATVVSRSDDWGATWKVVSPDGRANDNPRFDVEALVDAPGGFIAATPYGLVHFN